VDGKKILTAKDTQGKLLFSGSVETKGDRDKMPADVRERYEKLQRNDLPVVAPGTDSDEENEEDADEDDDAMQSTDTVCAPACFHLCVMRSGVGELLNDGSLKQTS